MKVQNLNKKQACWILHLSRFNFTLKHVLGTKMEKVDRLSRRLDWKVGVEKDNTNQTLIREQQIYSLVEVVIEEFEVDIIEKIKIAKEKNKQIVKVVEEMKKVEFKVLWENKQQVEGDLVLKERKVYMLNNKELRIDYNVLIV